MVRSGRPLGLPGSPPLSEKRDLYLKLMAQGMSNVAACRTVGVNCRTGKRWRYRRRVVTVHGKELSYPPITKAAPSSISNRFLSENERVVIADGLQAGRTIRAIASELGRSPSTVSREVRRNRDPASGGYRPWTAQRSAVARRARPRPGKLAAAGDLHAFVADHLESRWSPEQISGDLPRQFPDRPEMRIAAETIYQALYHGRGQLQRDPATVLRSRRARRRPHRRGERRLGRFAGPMAMIDQRPAHVADRLEAGHWEGDLVMGQGNRSAIGTLVERSTRYLVLLHLPDGHGPDQVHDALVATMAILPPQLKRSLTWDQGTEMHCHLRFTAGTGIPIFFCQPASPWQRGSNENANGLLRQYVPKGTDLSRHSADQLAAVAAEINARPRKTLGRETPADRFNRLQCEST
jgi:IS30 family transposase